MNETWQIICRTWVSRTRPTLLCKHQRRIHEMAKGGAIPNLGPSPTKNFKPGLKKRLLGFRPLYFEGPYHVFFFKNEKNWKKVAQRRGYSPHRLSPTPLGSAPG